MKNWFPIIILLLTLSSCIEKKTAEPKLILKSNSPVQFGKKLKVYIDSDDDFYYTIIHPDGREYEQTYEAQEARGSDGGKYVAYVYNNDGNLRQDSILVDVNPAPVPCANPVNKLTSNSFNFEMDFYNVGGGRGWSSYEVNGTSMQGDFQLTFGGQTYTPTESRTYITETASTFNTSDEVSLKINNGGLLFYGTPGQLVHMEIDSLGNKAITLCDYEVTTGSSNNPTIINVRLEY